TPPPPHADGALPPAPPPPQLGHRDVEVREVVGVEDDPLRIALAVAHPQSVDERRLRHGVRLRAPRRTHSASPLPIRSRRTLPRQRGGLAWSPRLRSDLGSRGVWRRALLIRTAQAADGSPGRLLLGGRRGAATEHPRVAPGRDGAITR